MKTTKLVSLVLFSVIASGCRATSQPIAFKAAPSPKAERRDNDESQTYRTVNLAVWNLDSTTRLEARIETLTAPPSGGSPGAPSNRLTVKNITTGASIYETSSGDRPVSMYTRDLNDDGREELVLTWGGGSADRLEILTVSSKEAQVVLDESYRIDATLIDLSGKALIDVLITTGESGAGPFHTTRYEWKNERYVPVGKVPYDVLIRCFEKQFALDS